MKDSLKTWLPVAAFVVLIPLWRGVTDSFDRKPIIQLPPVQHLIPPPSGFVDVMQPGSPGAKYYEEVQATWKLTNYKQDPSVISSLFLASELEKHEHGKSVPTDSRYYVVSFQYSTNPQQTCDVTKQQMIKLTGADLRAIVEKQNPGYPVKIGDIEQLGIVKDWGSGFISATVMPFEVSVDSAKANWKKLVLTCFMTHPRGVYTISGVNQVKGSNNYNTVIAEAELFAKAIQETNRTR